MLISPPQFTNIDMSNFPQRLATLLQDNLQKIDALLKNNPVYTWQNLMYPLDATDDALERFWSPLAHLHAVMDSQPIRQCYEACLPLLSDYETKIGHNVNLYRAIKSIDTTTLDSVQQKIVLDGIKDFELSGVALAPAQKERFEAIDKRLSELTNNIDNNVMDAEGAFSLHVENVSNLKGLPEHALQTAKELAEHEGVDGWILNLEFPCYLAVVTYAENRSLRETMYQAFVTRASDEGPNAKEFDNLPLMNEILALRHEKAQLLGFANFAELSLATKMAESPAAVLQFLTDLAHRARPQAQEEYQALCEFAAKNLGIDPIQPWDLAFASEKLRQARYSISQEELRAYFPLPKVMEGLFTIVERLYGMQAKVVKGVNTWHKDVQCYSLTDENNQLRGYIYVDLFARAHKHGGAWMDSLQSRWLPEGKLQVPIATLTCNFAKATNKKPAMLSHDEIETLFHEFGHCLQHVLTQVNYLGASGISGVEWDAVELPSQFFENWCWDKESLQLLSAHADTGEVLPTPLFEKLLATKNFQSAMAMLRQLEFSLFDFRMHLEYKSNTPGYIQNILNEVRQNIAVVPTIAYNRFQNTFTHVFGGGYAAGYYSYSWAEVLSSDAFVRFAEEGIFNKKTGRDFLHCILEVGGSKPAMEAFVDFRGKMPTIDALLAHKGIQG
jgi:oligopeptidase A